MLSLSLKELAHKRHLLMLCTPKGKRNRNVFTCHYFGMLTIWGKNEKKISMLLYLAALSGSKHCHNPEKNPTAFGSEFCMDKHTIILLSLRLDLV